MEERINPAVLVEVYEALDTIQEDRQALIEEHLELEPILLSEAQDLRDEATARMLLEQDMRKRSRDIEKRHDYITSSTQNHNYMSDDLLVAASEYLAHFEDQGEDAMDEAMERIFEYQITVKGLMRSIEETPNYLMSSELLPRLRPLPAPIYEGPDLYINPEAKRTDEMGRTWVNICHPRGVLKASSCDKDPEKITAMAGVVANLGRGVVTDDKTGTIHVEFSDGRAPLSFVRDSTLYRLNDQGNVEVIRPANIVGSVMDVMYAQDPYRVNGVLRRQTEARQVAEGAAGYPGSIWDTFNDPQGNPRTISVAKRN
jgi:hypothetical protein